jgi:threonine synthase
MGSLLSHLQCARCERELDANVVQNRCPCGGTLFARYHLERFDSRALEGSGLWRYRQLLPVTGDALSLGEPRTPLVSLPALSERWNVEVWLKDDGGLQGGTFKARGACMGVARARELGATEVVLPSAGNAGGAWSLYGARAGLGVTVTMAKSAPITNQIEVELAGGHLELVEGTIADAGARAQEIARSRNAYLAATFSEPYRLEGKKSAWFELREQLGRWPRTLVLPVGGGIAAVAASKAVEEMAEASWATDEPPRMVGVQPAGCAPLVEAFEGDGEVRPWPALPETIAAGLRVPSPSEGALVLERVRASDGSMIAVEERHLVAAVGELATAEGVLACPEGAATVAAAATLARAGKLEGPVVLYNTGTGAKYLGALAETLRA